MKKKIAGVLLGLFLSMGLVHPTCAVGLSCKTIMTVCYDYFATGHAVSDYWNAFGEHLTYLAELEVVECSELVEEDTYWEEENGPDNP